MNIVVSANSKYMRYLYVMLVSLFENNRDSAITIYVMQKDFSDYDKRNINDLALSFGQEVVFLYVDRSRFAGLPVTEKFSIEAYFRLIMGELLPVKVDKALYLDVDVIVYGRIRELYETDITGYIAAVCPDMDHPVLDPAKRELFGRKVDLRKPKW